MKTCACGAELETGLPRLIITKHPVMQIRLQLSRVDAACEPCIVRQGVAEFNERNLAGSTNKTPLISVRNGRPSANWHEYRRRARKDPDSPLAMNALLRAAGILRVQDDDSDAYTVVLKGTVLGPPSAMPIYHFAAKEAAVEYAMANFPHESWTVFLVKEVHQNKPGK